MWPFDNDPKKKLEKELKSLQDARTRYETRLKQFPSDPDMKLKHEIDEINYRIKEIDDRIAAIQAQLERANKQEG